MSLPRIIFCSIHDGWILDLGTWKGGRALVKAVMGTTACFAINCGGFRHQLERFELPAMSVHCSRLLAEPSLRMLLYFPFGYRNDAAAWRCLYRVSCEVRLELGAGWAHSSRESICGLGISESCSSIPFKTLSGSGFVFSYSLSKHI
jgi:hypothetical protein